MNRQNFLGHLALAVTLVLLAAFVGQIRRWQKEEWQASARLVVSGPRAIITNEVIEQNESDAPEVLVRFRPGTSVETIEDIMARFNDHVEDEIEVVGGLVAIDDGDDADAEWVAAQYRALNSVEYAEPNYKIELEPRTGESFDGTTEWIPGGSASAPNDPMFSEQWSLRNAGQRDGKPDADIRALGAWGKIKGSDKVIVAVLDSGVDYTHRDLFNNIWVRPADVSEYADDDLGTVNDIHGYNAVDNSGDPMDENGHGTHCAGIIGAEGNNKVGIAGVNWKVQIMPLKFMSKGGFGTTKDAIEAINYVINRKRAGVNVRVISASWGSTMYSRALEDAIRKAGEEGILFVAASGNASADADKSPHYPASYDLPNVISVAALTRKDQLASFSNYGAKRVHIAAPGAEILSTWLGGDFREASGTSMATPVVSGVAALILATDSDLSVKELRERLFKSIDKLDSLNGKVSTGGRINAAKAVGAE